MYLGLFKRWARLSYCSLLLVLEFAGGHSWCNEWVNENKHYILFRCVDRINRCVPTIYVISALIRNKLYIRILLRNLKSRLFASTYIVILANKKPASPDPKGGVKLRPTLLICPPQLDGVLFFVDFLSLLARGFPLMALELIRQ